MGNGERISRRAVVRAGENAAEMMESQAKFMADVSRVVDAVSGHSKETRQQLEDHIDKFDEEVSDTDNRFEELKESTREATARAEDYIDGEIEKVHNDIESQVGRLDERADVILNMVLNFRSMGLLDRLKWLFRGYQL